MEPYDLARAAFDGYAALDAPLLPIQLHPQLQVRLFRWAQANFKPWGSTENVLGVSEEMGELAEALTGLLIATGRLDHTMLKHMQGIRGYGDENHFRRQAADAVADMMIFATQLCTTLRIDMATLYQATAEEVMKREWKKKEKANEVFAEPEKVEPDHE